MSLDSLLRSNQVLTGADALLPDPTDSILHADDPVLATSALDALPVGDLPDVANVAGEPTGDLTSLANATVLDIHVALEQLADANGLVGSIHGLTNLGETIGLGHIGGNNLLTELAATPTALTSGDTSGLGGIVPQATAIDGAVDQLLGGTAGDAGANPGLLGPVTNVLPETQGVTAGPAEAFANDVVLDLHNTLELAGDSSNLLYTTHGLTNLGETIGLGRIGGDNLVTDVLDTPQGLLSGDTSSLTHVPTDVGNIVGAANAFVSGVETDLANGGFLADPVGNLTNFGEALTTFPVTSVANEAVDTIHTTLELALDPIAPNTIHGIIGLGNTVGLGEIGGANAVTDVLDAPGALLAGNTAPITDLPGDVAAIGSAAGAALGGIGADLGQNSLVDSLTHPTTGGGLLGGDLPGQGIVGEVTSTVTGALGAGDAAGLGGVTQAVTSTLGGSQGGLVHDVAQVPGDVLGGLSGGVAPLPGDAGSGLGDAGGIVGAVAGVVPEVASTVTSTVTDTLAPVTGGGAGGVVATATGLAGSLTGSSDSGSSHDLVTVSVGPQTPTSGANIDVLSSGDGPTHLVDSHVGTVDAPVPTLATVAVAPDSLSFPPATGGGSDALSGLVSTVAPVAGPTDAGAAANTTVDLGVAHVDVPIVAAHADPLAAATHAIAL